MLDRRHNESDNLDNSGGGQQLNLTDGEPQLYRVLADYSALSDRELSMEEGEVVELVKVGCGGWWFVRWGKSLFQKSLFRLFNLQHFRVANYPDVEGWAPETYLERIPSRSFQSKLLYYFYFSIYQRFWGEEMKWNKIGHSSRSSSIQRSKTT